MLQKYLNKDYGCHEDWTISPKGSVYSNLIALIKELDKENEQREFAIVKNMQMYLNCHATNIVSAFKQFNSVQYPTDNRVVLNIAKSCVDTVSAKISKNKVKITVVTDNADYLLKKKAKLLDKAVYSIMLNEDFHNIAKQCFLDACIAGTGIIHTYQKDSEVKYERVLPYEVLVDELDAQYGKPSKLYRFKLISIDKLKSLFPKKESDIESIQPISFLGGSKIEPSTFIYEAWSLIEKRHVVCCETCDLIDEEFLDEKFPFSFLYWTKPLIGFWGVALIDEISPIQQEINKLLYFIQKNMHLNASGKWFFQEGSIDKQHMTNEFGTMIPFKGGIPQYVAPAPVNYQVLNHISFLKDEAYAIAGISQLSSRSEKPSGLNSGKALQTYNDIESERFVLVGQSYEQLYLDVFNRTIDIAKNIAEENPKFNIISASLTNREVLVWKDIDMEKDLYTIKPFPTSALPQQPEARLEMLSIYQQLGLIDQDQFLELMDLPDLQAFNSQKLSPKKVIESVLTEMLTTRVYVAPSKYFDLNLASKMSLDLYNQLVVSKAPLELQDLMLQYLDECQEILNEAKTADQPSPEALPQEPVQLPEQPIEEGAI